MDCPTNHDAYVGPHPEHGGFFVYCADCDLETTARHTREEAIQAWRSGDTIEFNGHRPYTAFVGDFENI